MRNLRPAGLRLSAEHLTIFQRLARLRVATVPQAHALVDALGGHSLVNAYKRLQRLARDGYLELDLVRPERGRYSPCYYRLASPAVRVLETLAKRDVEARDPKEPRERPLPHARSGLLGRPRQHILEYLLFRNDLYAAARVDGWAIVSPLLSPREHHDAALRVFREWALLAKERVIRALQASGAPAMDVQKHRREKEQLPAFLPSRLGFEFLVKRDGAGRPAEVVLLVIDDPRLSVSRQARFIPSGVDLETSIRDSRGKVTGLPGLRLLLRDGYSQYDLATRRLHRPSPRYRTWQRELMSSLLGISKSLPADHRAVRDGAAHLKALDTLFPDLWARRVGVSPAHPEPRKEGP